MAQKKKTMKRTPAKKHVKKPIHRHRVLRVVLWIVGVILALGLALYIFWNVSPWPKVMLIRYEFTKNEHATSAALEKYVPAGITSKTNLQYQPNDNDAYLDVHYPASAVGSSQNVPLIVWVHGGAWISGNKDDRTNYAKILAGRSGYAVASVNYSIAPEKKYPTPVMQVSEALAYLNRNADSLGIDASRIMLAGDSAGSQIAAQVAAIISNPSYGQEINIPSTLQNSQLKGVILNCGAYDIALPNYKSSEAGEFLQPVLWAYSGKKDFLNYKEFEDASVINFVTKDYPPSFITAGNADPLEEQSTVFAKKLASLDVQTDTLFYPNNHQPALPHEYQFNLDTEDGKQALDRIVAFAKRYM